jgi:phenylpropionate dioxygenase-like ring-hydroxylating dioxygenase large terminal subunit
MSDTPFLRNAWYMAGWSSELDDGRLIARRMLDEPVVVFRDSKGVAQALADRCPHRFAPLSRGKVKGDVLQCGYHGLGFDGTGYCVANPYPAAAGRSIRIRRYSVMEQDRIVWVWFGVEGRADAARIPRFPRHDAKEFRFVFGHSEIRSDYQLVADNLLDLSHTTFIHPAFGGEFWVPEFRMEQQGERVIAHYKILNSPPSIFSEGFFAAHGQPIDEHATMFWDAASVMRLDIKWAFSDRPDHVVSEQPSAHVLTPMTESRTWYFWASGALKEAPISDEQHRAALVQAFESEDAPMVEACAANIGREGFWASEPVILPYDTAAVRARRILLRKIREERAPAVPAGAGVEAGSIAVEP